MILLRAGNRQGAGSTPGAYSETAEPGRANARAQLGVRGRVVAVDPAAEDGDRRAAGLESSPVRFSVDASREPADDDDARRGELPAEHPRHLRAVRRARPRADDGDGRPPQRLRCLRLRARRGRAAGRGSPPGAAGSPGRSAAATAPRSPPGRARYAAFVERAGERAERGIAARLAARGALFVSAANAASASSLTPFRARSANGRQAPRRGARRRRRGSPASAAIVSATRLALRPAPSRERQALDRAIEKLGRLLRPLRPRRRRAARARRSTRWRTGVRRLARRSGELGRARPRHGDDEVEPVEERPRELVPERGEPLWRALAIGRGIAARTAGAEVHRRDELEPGREDRPASDPRDADEAVLERLAERLERGPLELRELVEDEHTPVREADLARLRPGPAADERRDRRVVVRRAQRPGGDRAAGPARASPRPSGSASPRAPRRSRAAAGSRAAGARASSCRFRAARRGEGCGRPRRRSRARGGPAPGPARRRGRARGFSRWMPVASRPRAPARARREGRRQPRERCRREPARCRRAPPRRTSAPRRGSSATRRAAPPPPARSRPRRAGGCPSSAELADGGVLVEPLARDLPRGGEDRQSDREVEARALLPQARGREIDRDPPANGPFELRRGDSAPDALLRLLAGAVGEPDDREAGDAALSRCASTSTRRASSPTSACVTVRAST